MITQCLLALGLLAMQRSHPVLTVSVDQEQTAIDGDGVFIQSTTRDALLASSIIPDACFASSISASLVMTKVYNIVLDDFVPHFSLQLTYPATHTTVSLGNEIPPSHVRKTPVFDFYPFTPPPSLGNARSNKTYILVLTDPDAKSRKNPIWSEMCHWVVTNVTSPELGGPGDPGEPPVPAVLKSYLPPNPPAGTNWHRYVFVLMAADQTQAEKLQAPKRRKHWGYGEVRHGVRDWANEYRLQVLGANFFYAKSE